MDATCLNIDSVMRHVTGSIPPDDVLERTTSTEQAHWWAD